MRNLLIGSILLLFFYSCKKSENSNCDANAAKGPLFTAAKTLIVSRCSSGGVCHINGGNADGYNFDADCSVVDNWSKIREVCNSGRMPIAPQSPLSTDEKQVINDWVNAGHRITD